MWNGWKAMGAVAAIVLMMVAIGCNGQGGDGDGKGDTGTEVTTPASTQVSVKPAGEREVTPDTGYANAKTSANAQNYREAPDFTLTDIKGDALSLSDLRGQWVVLEWVNHGCPYVKKHYESDNMQQLQKKYTEEGVAWLTICSSAPGKQGYMSPQQWQQESDKRGVGSTAVLLDPTGEVGKSYGAKVTPHMFVIDPAGKIVYEGAIDSIPSAKPGDIPQATNYVAAVLDAGLRGEDPPYSYEKPYGCGVKYGS